MAGQLGVEFRVIRVGDAVVRTFGVVDLWVAARPGWARVANRCSWLRISDHVTLGLAGPEDTGALMVKATGAQAWPDGDVDLPGHLF